MSKIIPYGRQYIDEEDIEAVKNALKSDFLTQGIKVKEFERRLSDYCGAKYAVVFSSGTAALHGAYFAAGLTLGDELITTPITFLATANAALFLGAKPLFVDIQPDTGNINPNLIKEKITGKTKVIVAVDYSGQPADLEKIYRVAKENKLLIIEDACHALGAKYRDSRIGSCKYSDMVVFSFHPLKSITTGEGGAILTDNKDYYEKLLMFRHHGVTKNPVNFKQSSEFGGDWYYEMHYLGYNYRLTDIQCALGISQLRKLNNFIARRRKLAQNYNKAFKESPYLTIPQVKSDRESAWHLYPLRLKLGKMTKTRGQVFEELRSLSIGVQIHYIPLHLQPYYRDNFGYQRGYLPEAEAYYDSTLTIPLFPGLSNDDCKRVIKSVLKVVK